MPNLILGAEVHRLVPKLFRAEITRAEHRLPRVKRCRFLKTIYKVVDVVSEEVKVINLGFIVFLGF